MENFKELFQNKNKISLILDSFDSPKDIIKTYTKNKWAYHEFLVGKENKRYRIEYNTPEYSEEVEILFDRWDKNTKDWIFDELTKDLSTKEVFEVFSTVVQVARKNNLNKRKAVFATTMDTKKSMLYRRLFSRMFSGTHNLSIIEGDRFVGDKIIAIKKDEKNNKGFFKFLSKKIK